MHLGHLIKLDDLQCLSANYHHIEHRRLRHGKKTFMSSVLDGVVIGGAGGAIAGITVYFVQYVHDKIKDHVESKTIYEWLVKNTSDERGEKYRSTRAIASWNNLTQDRVRYLCSVDNRVYLSTGTKDDVWAIRMTREDR